MESTTILTLLAPAIFCFPPEPNIPEGPEYEKNINTISMYEEKLYQLFLDYSNVQVSSCFQFCNMAWVNALLCPTSYYALLCPTSYAKRSFF